MNRFLPLFYNTMQSNTPTTIYFVPPNTSTYVYTGFMIFTMLLFVFMFIGIFLIYIYATNEQYQDRIHYITKSWIFAKDPNSVFKKYVDSAIQNSQIKQGFASMSDAYASSSYLATFQQWMGSHIPRTYLTDDVSIQSTKSLNLSTNRIIDSLH